MGAQNSNMRRCIEDEFSRLTRQGRDYLVLNEILQLRLPPTTWTLDPCHLAVLWMLDKDRDGRFTCEEVMVLMELGFQRTRMYQPHEFSSQLSGWCTLQLFRAMGDAAGRDAAVDWMCQLLVENGEVKRFPQAPSQTFISCNNMASLYQLLQIQESQGVGMQAFFDIVQRMAEERGLMDLGAEEQDDWLPLSCVRHFLESLFGTMVRTMAEIVDPDDVVALEEDITV